MTPDPRFVYANPKTEEAFATLRYAIDGRKGFALLTGEVGTGKTTLLRRLMAGLRDTPFVLIFNPKLGFDEILDLILDELGLEKQHGTGRRAAIQTLNEFLLRQAAAGKTTALLVDEAQDLDDGTLEELRLLSNLETDGEKLLQILLVGQIELDEKLAQPALRQLGQRIALRSHLERLEAREVKAYVEHRLRIAGAARTDVFEPGAIELVARYSKGIPRLVNVICDNACVAAYAASRARVREDDVLEAAVDLRLRERPAQANAGTRVDPVELAMRVVSRSTAAASDREPRRLGRLKGVLGIALAAALTLALFSGGDWEPALAAIEQQALALFRVEAPLPGPSRVEAAIEVRASEPAREEATRPEPLRETAAKADPIEPEPAPHPAAPHPAAPAPVEPPPPVAAAASSDADAIAFRLQRGFNVLRIAAAAYGEWCGAGLDLLAEANPQIRDLDFVIAGEVLRLPRVDRSTLVRADAANAAVLRLGAFGSANAAQRLANDVTRKTRHRARIVERAITPRVSLYRVEVTELTTDGVDEVWRWALERGLVPGVPVPAEQVRAEPTERACFSS